MRLAQDGDREAYRLLLDDVSAMLKGFLRTRVVDPDEAADVLQEILMAVHRGRHTYDPARPFEPWLFGIARHVLVDHVRRRTRMGRVEVLDDVAMADVPGPEIGMRSDLLRDALGRLPHAQREAFDMLHVEGLSVAAAAARAGTSAGALKVRAHRAYKTIRQLLLRS